MTEVEPSVASHATGAKQADLGARVSKQIQDGCWGQLVAPFSSTAPHGIDMNGSVRSRTYSLGGSDCRMSVWVLDVIGCLIRALSA